MVDVLWSSRCVTRGHFTHTYHLSAVLTQIQESFRTLIKKKKSIRSFFFSPPQQIFVSRQSITAAVSLLKIVCLINIKTGKSTGRMQLSRAFMIYELGIETRISPCATESQTYTPRFKSKAGKTGTRRAKGSVLLRNCVQAVLPAAVKNKRIELAS